MAKLTTLNTEKYIVKNIELVVSFMSSGLSKIQKYAILKAPVGSKGNIYSCQYNRIKFHLLFMQFTNLHNCL